MMRIEVKALREALRAIEKVVERRNTIPILSNVKLVGSTRELRLIATDLTMQIEQRVSVESKGPMVITVPAAVLAGIVAKLPAGDTATIKLDEAKGLLTIGCGRAKFTLATLPADDFPDMAMPDGATRFALSAAVLAHLFGTVRFATSTQETRYYLNGVYLHRIGETLLAVATDGHRLARIETAAPAESEGMPGVIVGNKTVDVVRQLLDKVDDAVELAIASTRIEVRLGGTVLIAKLIDGTFPDYMRVIPAANEKRLRIAPADFATAIDRVAVISSEKTRSIRLDFRPDVVTLIVNSPEHGEAREECPCGYEAAGLTIGFNARFLLDILRRIEGETVEVLLDDPATPTLFRASEAASATFVLMPMRV